MTESLIQKMREAGVNPGTILEVFFKLSDEVAVTIEQYKKQGSKLFNSPIKIDVNPIFFTKFKTNSSVIGPVKELREDGVYFYHGFDLRTNTPIEGPYQEYLPSNEIIDFLIHTKR